MGKKACKVQQEAPCSQCDGTSLWVSCVIGHGSIQQLQQVAWLSGQCPMGMKVDNVRKGGKAHVGLKNYAIQLLWHGCFMSSAKVTIKNSSWLIQFLLSK
jgi:hypothetical protein